MSFSRTLIERGNAPSNQLDLPPINRSIAAAEVHHLLGAQIVRGAEIGECAHLCWNQAQCAITLPVRLPP